MNGIVGRVAFGPTTDASEQARRAREFDALRRQSFSLQASASLVQACNCIGPQAGQRKCPCALRAESDQGRRMVSEGVTINCVEYDLVPKRKPTA